MTAVPEEEDDYGQVMKSAKMLLVASKELKDIVCGTVSHDGTLLTACEKLYVALKDISFAVHSIKFDGPSVVALRQIKLDPLVGDYIQKAKAAYNGTGDPSILSQLTSSLHSLTEGVKKVVTLLDTIQQEEYASIAAATVSATLCDNSKEENLRFIHKVKNVAVMLAQLQTSAQSLSQETFVLGAKSFNDAVGELVFAANLKGLQANADQIKQQSLAILSIAKLTFTSKSDPTYVDQLKKGVSKLSEAIKSLLHSGTSPSSAPLSPLPRPVSPLSIEKREEENIQEEANSVTQDSEEMKSLPYYHARSKSQPQTGESNSTIDERKKRASADYQLDNRISHLNLSKPQSGIDNTTTSDSPQHLDIHTTATEKMVVIADPSINDPGATPVGPKRHRKHFKSKHKSAFSQQQQLVRLSSQLLATIKTSLPQLAESWDNLEPEKKDSIQNAIVDSFYSACDIIQYESEEPCIVTSPSPSPVSPRNSMISDARNQSKKDLNVLMSLSSRRDSTNNTFNDFQKVLIRTKIGQRLSGRADTRPVPSSEEERRQMMEKDAAVEELIALAASFGDAVLGIMMHATSCFVSSRTEETYLEFVALMSSTHKLLIDLMSMCLVKVSQEAPEPDLPAVKDMYEAVRVDLSSTSLKGVVNSNIASAAGGASLTLKFMEGGLERQCFTFSNCIRVHLCLLLSTISALCNNTPSTLQLFEIVSTATGLVSALGNLANCVESAKFLKLNQGRGSESLNGSDVDREGPMWDELLTPRKYLMASDGQIRAATLNKLVECATPCNIIEPSFLMTFATTFCSFTTPLKLFDKLLERYNVPPEKPDLKKIVQMRVIIFIKHWVESQFDEFDDELLAKLNHFFDVNCVNDGWGTAVSMMKSELERKKQQRERKIKTLLIPPCDIIIPEERLSPIRFFMETKTSAIARQLTLIDAKIFQAIEPRELLDLAWSKPKLQHRAPNVIHLLARSNQLSAWMSQLILMCPTDAMRSSMLLKLVDIAQKFKKLNNYHTLMSFIVGFSNSSITRLKTLMATIDKARAKSLKSLESLMDPSGSFRNYRQELSSTNAEISLPFIGVVLSDLTFIEEGNPDQLEGMINFEKRALVHKAITAITVRLNQTYTFPIQEPLHTFLLELPALSDKLLYQISLIREPRPPLATGSSSALTPSTSITRAGTPIRASSSKWFGKAAPNPSSIKTWKNPNTTTQMQQQQPPLRTCQHLVTEITAPGVSDDRALQLLKDEILPAQAVLKSRPCGGSEAVVVDGDVALAWNRAFMDLIGESCNPREVFIIISEILESDAFHPQPTKILLLPSYRKVLLRIPETRHKFLEGLPQMISIIFRQLKEIDPQTPLTPTDSSTTETESNTKKYSFTVMESAHPAENLIESSVLNAILSFVAGFVPHLIKEKQHPNTFHLKQRHLLQNVVLMTLEHVGSLSGEVELFLTKTALGILFELGLSMHTSLETLVTLRKTEKSTAPPIVDFHRIAEIIEESTEEEVEDAVEQAMEDFRAPTVNKLSPATPEMLLQRFPHSVIGLGVLLHSTECLPLTCLPSILVLPSVLRPNHKLAITLPFITALLARPSKGWNLLDVISRPIGKASIEPSLLEDITACIQAMIDCMSQCEDSTARTSMYNVMGKTIGFLRPGPRFDAIKKLIAQCSNYTMTGLIIHRLKEEINQSWPNTCCDAEESSNFASRRLLEILPVFLVPRNFSEKFDIIIQGINLYRYLLIRDRGTNYTGIWSKSEILEVDNNFLQPLKDELTRLKEQSGYGKTMTDEQASSKIADLTNFGLPKMSIQEFKQTNAQVITNILLIEDLLSRVDELLKAP
ncbi:Ras guanine nucleotide exchange factor [Pelomyxa schiedti]|nr:Ras guanine nucleotide exchange factor [Pelomyxa schiedti]